MQTQQIPTQAISNIRQNLSSRNERQRRKIREARNILRDHYNIKKQRELAEKKLAEFEQQVAATKAEKQLMARVEKNYGKFKFVPNTDCCAETPPTTPTKIVEDL